MFGALYFGQGYFGAIFTEIAATPLLTFPGITNTLSGSQAAALGFA